MNAPCINPNDVINTTRWLDYYLIQSGAIRHAFADLNADLASGRIPACPQTFLPCPLQPYVMVAGFSSAGFSDTSSGADEYLGGVTVANEHTVFPGYTQDMSVQNLQVRVASGRDGSGAKQQLGGARRPRSTLSMHPASIRCAG